MRKTVATAVALGALIAAPAGAQTNSCPPGATNTDYCQVAVFSPGISLNAGQKLATVLKSGLPVTVTCNQACTLSVTVTAPKPKGASAAKVTVVAKGNGKLATAGKKTIRVRFTTQAKKAYRTAKKLKLTVNVQAKNAAGVKTTIKKSVSLKR